MRAKFLIVLLISIFSLTDLSSAISNPNNFLTTGWNLNSQFGFDSIEVDITPEVVDAPLIDGYFFANLVYFKNAEKLNVGGAYAGLQTNGYNGSKYIGKMAIFSVWDVNNGGIKEKDGWLTRFDGEGAGVSVRIPYSWTTGRTYRLKIYIEKNLSNNQRLWGASLTDLSTKITKRIGQIYVPKDRGKIFGPATFHERYLGKTAYCSQVKKSQVSFTNMTANNGKVKPTSWETYFTAIFPECPGISWNRKLINGVQSGIKTPKPRTTTIQ
jgi:hypothetical protein